MYMCGMGTSFLEEPIPQTLPTDPPGKIVDIINLSRSHSLVVSSLSLS